MQKQENLRLKSLFKYSETKYQSLPAYDVNAAVKIQAFIKGWLCRKNYEKVRTS